MLLKELIEQTKLKEVFIKSTEGNSKWYDHFNMHLMSDKFREDEVDEYEIKTFCGTPALVVRLKHWN